MKLKYKIPLIVNLLSIVGIFVISVTLLTASTMVLQQRTQNQLESIVSLKEFSLDNTLTELTERTESLAASPGLVDIYATHNSSAASSRLFLNEKFLKELTICDEFKEFFIMDLNGVIDYSTDPMQEGKIKSDDAVFIQGIRNASVQRFSYDSLGDEPNIMLSAPVLDRENKTVAVLGARLAVDKISNILAPAQGLGESGQTLLVNKYFYLVSEPRYLGGQEFKKTIITEASKDCIKGNDRTKKYLDYRGVEVLGTYKWMSQYESCLITKVDYSEIMKPINNFTVAIIIISIISLLTVTIGSFILTLTITSSLSDLKNSANQIAHGELDKKIIIVRDDEIGDLSRHLDTMRQKIKDSRAGLQGKTTELENALNQLTKVNEELKKLDQVKSEFIAIASHELRTPLTSIIGFIELILTEPTIVKDQKKFKEMITIAFNESKRLHHLINDILNLSKMEAGKMNFDFKVGDIKEVINIVRNEALIIAEKKGIKIITDFSPGIPKLHFDKGKLEEAISNLVNNAVKILGNNDTITIKAFKDSPYLNLLVTDSGPGIPPDKVKDLFKPFVQVGSVDSHHEGTGLGLAITKRIIEAHKGDVTVKSQIGKGTTFTLRLPLK